LVRLAGCVEELEGSLAKPRKESERMVSFCLRRLTAIFGIVVSAILFQGTVSAVSVTLDHPVPLRAESIDLLRNVSVEDSDQWKLIVFGFTHCSDVCPMSLANFSRLVKIAEERQIGLDGAFVTVDPDRDTDVILSGYTKNFGRNISYLRLQGEELERFKNEFGVEAVFYTKNEGNKFNYQVDHSTTAFLVDPDGRIRVVFDALKDSDSIAEMLRGNQEFFEL